MPKKNNTGFLLLVGAVIAAVMLGQKKASAAPVKPVFTPTPPATKPTAAD